MTVQDIVAKLKAIREKYEAAVAAAKRERDLAETSLCEQADLTREKLEALARPAPAPVATKGESPGERRRRLANEALRKTGML